MNLDGRLRNKEALKNKCFLKVLLILYLYLRTYGKNGGQSNFNKLKGFLLLPLIGSFSPIVTDKQVKEV